MLYSNGNTTDFPKLAEAMSVYGIRKEAIEIAVEYLDTSKERNNSLLDRIPRHALINDEWSKREKLERAIKREIISTKSEELFERYILLSQAIYGSYAYVFVMCACRYYDKFIKQEDRFIKIMSSRFGEKAEACLLAMYVAQLQGRFFVSYGFKIKSPQTCVDAVDFADDNPVTIAQLCAYALNQSLVPEKKGIIAKLVSKSETDHVVEKAVEYVHGLIDRNPSVYIQLMCATGEGAYFSDKCRKYFTDAVKKCKEIQVAEYAIDNMPNPERVLDMIAEIPDCVDYVYIAYLVDKHMINQYVRNHLETLAVKYTDEYVKAMELRSDVSKAKIMADILAKANPKYIIKENALKEKAQVRVSRNVSNHFKCKNEVRSYLMGNGTINDILPLIKDDVMRGYNGEQSNYKETYGFDDFMKRVITLCAVSKSISWWIFKYYTDFKLKGNEKQFINILAEQNLSAEIILETLGNFIESIWSEKDEVMFNFANAIAERADMFADVDIKDMNINSRWIYVSGLGIADADKYKSQILALVGDTSKFVKKAVTEVISSNNWKDDIIEFLQSKKAGIREIAVSVIEKKKPEDYREALEKAFEKEKSEKIKTRIALLLDVNYSTETDGKSSENVDIVSGLVRASKAKKVAWLFEHPYKTVHFKDGGEVSEDYLNAMIIINSAIPSVTVNKTALEIAGKINPDELGDFTLDVFGRWLEKGAAAKTKWVLWFCGVHGGHDMMENLKHYIKEWSEHSRGAIASEAVYSMAVNGSSEALMNVDNMARKFKHRQVRNAANSALDIASKELGITKEELGDRIVPDMNFDENMCRVFDYGKRQFKVYLTPSLELEIYNGDKKVKNMAKPGVNDDKELAEKSYNDFKIMKKQIKAVIESQKSRLEYVLMCDRKWTGEAWNNLFVKNPVMHCFAVGLIWGIYEYGELKESFRYMDDGSFTNIDENEFEIPENAEIGLVHPIELTDEQRASWSEQLSDYEIIQPLNQLGRQFYKPDESELNQEGISRFEGKEVSDYTLRGKLTKMGWETGCPQDAGFFMEFVHDDDITVSEGYRTEIEFSGMCIDLMQNEMMTLETLYFYRKGTNKKLKIKDVNPRYFSEIVMQLTLIAGTEEQ
ncbi:MAG: DUF4132 domain-containing protein [Ruminococcus sp.]|nr:DUF4132 domain-containing protein [Ruminococcus sp.]